MRLKRNLLIFLIISLLGVLSGCSFINLEVSRVEAPTVSKPPIEGKWTVTKCIFPDDINEESFNYKEIIGSDMIFTNKGVIIGDLYSENPTYKAKKVNAQDYLFKKYNILKKKLSITNDSIYVVDIYDKDEFFYEVIKESDEVAYIYMKGFFAQITKSSKDISDEEFNKILEKEKSEINKSENIEELNHSENGFLIGLKSKEKDTKLPKWMYKTIYIKFLNDTIEDVYELDNILLPRQNEFAEVSVNRIEENAKIKDSIFITNKDIELGNLDKIKNSSSEEEGIKNILFVSPDYINIENLKVNNNEIDSLNLYYIDSLDNKKQIQLSDLIPKGEKLFKDAANSNIKTNDKIYYEDSNIGLIRNNGYWKLIGRAKIKGEEIYQKDFELNVLLPKGIVKYDNLIIPMSEIKKDLPLVRDVFISPNNRFLITLEENYLKVYNIKNGKLDKNSIYEKELKQDSFPIMSEWSIGRYSQIWQRKISSKN